MIYLKLSETIITIFIVMSVGIFTVRKGMLNKNDTKIFAALMYYITSPALILTSITSSVTRSIIISSLTVPAFAILATIISFMASLVIGRILGIKDASIQNVFRMASTFCNTVYIGLPIIQSIYGPKATSYVFFYDLGSQLVLWTIGMELVRRQKQFVEHSRYNVSTDLSIKKEDKHLKQCISLQVCRFKKILLNFINPSLVALTISIIMVALNLKLPEMLAGPLRMLGSITVPLSLLFIGMSVADFHISSKVFEVKIICIILIRMIFSPIIMGILTYFINIPTILKKVIVIEAGMPVMMFVAVLAKKYENSPEFAAKAVMLTTVMSILTLPIIIFILETVY